MKKSINFVFPMTKNKKTDSGCIFKVQPLL